MFIDSIHILLQAGRGGNGCESYFHRTDRKVVPNGGDGGKGGDIILRADPNAQPLGNLKFQQHILAENGGHGKSNKKRGAIGNNYVLLVPVGTKIVDRERDLLIRELTTEGDEVVVCEGGSGGSGNFGGKRATFGKAGVKLDVELSIRIRADVFIVGLPNSGQSTFLNAFTRAKSRVEPYPFTTKEPQIGVWKYSDFEDLTFCDMPSLYEGSTDGRGVGIDFLKHLELAKMILYFLDPMSDFSKSLGEGLKTLQEQIASVDSKFLSIPSVVVINKMDEPGAEESLSLETFKPGMPVFKISAKCGDGLEGLKKFLYEQLLQQSG